MSKTQTAVDTTSKEVKNTIANANDSISMSDTVERIQGAISKENVKEQIAGTIYDINKITEKAIFMLIEAIPAIVKTVIITIVGVFVIRTVMKIIRNRFEKRGLDLSLRSFLQSIIRFVLYAVLILTIVQTLGFGTSAILGALSGIVLAIGLALQGSLSNFAGGVLILVFRPFEVGDYIENNSNTAGTVEKIDLLYTTLTTVDGLMVSSPNGALANSVIRNFTKNPQRRFEYLIGIGYSDDIEYAKEVVQKVLENNEFVLKSPAPEVFVNELAESSVNLMIRAWAKKENYWDARKQLQQDIKIALDKANISIPFPQREMHIIQTKSEE